MYAFKLILTVVAMAYTVDCVWRCGGRNDSSSEKPLPKENEISSPSNCTDCNCNILFAAKHNLTMGHTRYCKLQLWWMAKAKFPKGISLFNGSYGLRTGVHEMPIGFTAELNKYMDWYKSPYAKDTMRSQLIPDLIQYELCQKDSTEYPELLGSFMRNMDYKMSRIEVKFEPVPNTNTVYFQLGARCTPLDKSPRDDLFTIWFGVTRRLVDIKHMHELELNCVIDWKSPKLTLVDLEKDETYCIKPHLA